MSKARLCALAALVITGSAVASDPGQPTSAASIAAQNAALERNTDGQGFGPQSPRDLAVPYGSNKRVFSRAPPHTLMNLCNVHLHRNAEHRGGEFTTYAGHGNGLGHGTGYRYSGTLTPAESQPLDAEICPAPHGGLKVGDTIEVHYVYSSALVTPGPSLNYCMSDTQSNPQLRVESVVLVLVNDPKAADLGRLTATSTVDGYIQAPNLPRNAGKPVEYAGSSTGPAYNEKGSPLKVSWSVRPRVLKVNAESVARWCKGNVFMENEAHGVRNLVTNEKLLSPIR